MKNKTFIEGQSMGRYFIYIAIASSWSNIYSNSSKKVNNINKEYKYYLLHLYDSEYKMYIIRKYEK